MAYRLYSSILTTQNLNNRHNYLPQDYTLTQKLGSVSWSDYYPSNGQDNTQNIQKTEKLDQFQVTGRIRFYNDIKNYGFLKDDHDMSDIFFHESEFKKVSLDLKQCNQMGYRIQGKVVCQTAKGTQRRKLCSPRVIDEFVQDISDIVVREFDDFSKDLANNMVIACEKLELNSK